ncbi:TPA: restriction endonuclease subunit S [Escherichia albertii]
MSWPMVKLGSVGEFKAGFGFPIEYQGKKEGDYPFAKVGDISAIVRGGHKNISHAGNYIDKDILVDLKAKTIPKGTIVFAKIGEAIKQNFRAITTVEMVIDNNVMGLVPDNNLVDTNYLFYFMRSLDLYQFSGATTIPALRKSMLENIQIPLPPLSEQKRIAAIFDKADGICQKRQKAIKLADDFLRATFLEMFGDPVTNPKGFDTRLLSDFFIDDKNGTKCGPFGSALKKDEYTREGVPVWNMDNITLQGDFIDSPSLWISEDKYRELNSYSVSDGDVIISRAGTVGKMGVVRSNSPKSIISTNLIRVRFSEKLYPEYFVSLMTYCKGRVGNLKTGPDGAFTHMNTGVLSNLEFPYPPLELQRKYNHIRQNVMSLIYKYNNYGHKIDETFYAINQKAFLGKP